jgi:arylsulfatase A-like enzyme/Flp pilus assembly protein TadD
MGRATGLFLAAAVGLAVGLWLYISRPWNASSAVTQASGPIVFISIDTLRADRLPAYGSTRTRTPNIDRLAADGVLFENAYAHSPQTLPSHTSLLSGQLPFEHGVRDNIGFTVKPDQRFLQHELKESGYSTGAFVSAYVLREQTGFHQGFDTFDDELPPSSPEEPLGQVQRGGEETMAAAMRWVDGTPSRFFLLVHIYEPHTPYAPPSRFARADPYDGEVEFADEIVGRLLDHLRAKGLYENAVIVLLSDHGEGLGDHGEEEHGIFLYRETIRVPLIIKLPRSRGGGRRVAAPVQHIDVVPTIRQLAGTTVRGSEGSAFAEATAGKPEVHGRSLLPVLEGTGEIAPANIYSESLSPRYHFGWSELYALSDDRYRLIRAPRDELYDLARDAQELSSIADDRPQVRTTMRSALDGMIANAGVTAPSSVSESDRQKLAALGYVGTQSGAALQLPGDKLPDPKDKIDVLKMYRRAIRLMGEKKHSEAAALFHDLLEDDPGMTDVWLQLAEAHNRQGRTGQALAAYKEVISRDPKNPAALTGATSALLRLGRLEEAKAHAELTVEVAPAIAHETLARIAVHQKDAAAAKRHAQLAQQADPTLPMTPFVEGMILHGQGQYGAAAERLLEARRAMAARTEQLPDLNYLAGDSLARLERYQEAEQLFRSEIAIFPAHVRARGGLAMLYKATGRDAEAERAINDILRVAPTPEGVDMAAQLWTMFGEPARAAAVRSRIRQEHRER